MGGPTKPGTHTFGGGRGGHVCVAGTTPHRLHTLHEAKEFQPCGEGEGDSTSMPGSRCMFRADAVPCHHSEGYASVDEHHMSRFFCGVLEAVPTGMTVYASSGRSGWTTGMNLLQPRRCEAQLLMIRPHMMWEAQLKVASPADLSM